MPSRDAPADELPPQLRRLRNVQRLSKGRSGQASLEHVRHQLYVAQDVETNARALLKVTTKPGLVYEQNLVNESEILSSINRNLPASRHFPLLLEHGRLHDRRMFVLMSFFDEWPLATAIDPERRPDRLVGHIATAIAVGAALADLHRIGIFHVDLNPMNVLYRSDKGRPVIRIVDFESAYDVARHGKGAFYNPPTTTGFSAPELRGHPPDRRADVFSLGAVLYTTIAGYDWTTGGDLSASVAADRDLDDELRGILRTAADATPAQRQESIEELSSALAAYLESIWPGRSASL